MKTLMTVTKGILTLCLSSFLANLAQAQTSPTQTGNWSDPATWGGTVPSGVEEDITIPAGITVTLDADAECGTIIVHGRLDLAAADLNLTCDSLVISGMGAEFEAGTAASRFTNHFTLTLKGDPSETFVHNTHDMGARALLAVMGGEISIHGRDRVEWTHLGADAAAGASSITLAEPVDWEAGDIILICSSRLSWNEAEQMEVASVSGDGLTVFLTASLAYPHSGFQQTYTRQTDGKEWVADLRAEVGLLSRNITIQGAADAEDSQDPNFEFGAHVMIHGPMDGMPSGQGFFQGVEIFRGGQLSLLGRYPFHWHLCVDSGAGQYFKDSSVHKSFNRAITIHGTDYATVENNFCYDHIGHGLFLEDGAERFNIIRKNVVALTKRPAPGEEVTPSDNEFNEVQNRTPASYWITNPNNTFEDNVAAGTQGTGFWFIFPQSPLALSAALPYYSGSEPYKEPLGSFARNKAHSCMSGFDVFDQLSSSHSIIRNAGWAENSDHILSDCTWYCNELALYTGIGNGGLSENLIWRDNILVDNTVVHMFASYAQVQESVIVADSFERLNTKNRSLFRTYDGAGQMSDCHLVGWNAPNASFNKYTGAATLHPNSRISGITTDHAGDFRIDLPSTAQHPVSYVGANAMGHPRLWGFSLWDVDGSLTGQAGSRIVSDHPFMQTGNDDQPSHWTGAIRSHNDFVLSILDSVAVGAQDRHRVTIERSHATLPSIYFYYINGFQSHHQFPLIANDDDFVYVYHFEKLPLDKPASISDPRRLELRIDDAQAGDTTIVALRHFGHFSGVNVTGHSISSHGSLAALKSASSSGYYLEPNGDLYIRPVATGKRLDLTITWTDENVGSWSSGVWPTLDTDGDGMEDRLEAEAGRHPFDVSDVGPEFNNDGDFENWSTLNTINNPVVANGVLSAESTGDSKIINNAPDFEASALDHLVLRYKADVSTSVQLFWKTDVSPVFWGHSVTASYSTPGVWQELVLDLSADVEWKDRITAMRLDPVAGAGSFEIDWMRFIGSGDADGDGIPDTVEGLADTDGDGILDLRDADSDGDGIPDKREGTADLDGDTLANYLDTDADGDGILDKNEKATDHDGDGIANFLDTDSDNDGIADLVEGGGDADGDGWDNLFDLDADGDGIADAVEGAVDTDNDGVANFLDLDSDGDGMDDGTELAQGTDALHPGDLRAEFNEDGNFEGWDDFRNMTPGVVVGGVLSATTTGGSSQIRDNGLYLDATLVQQVVMRYKSPSATTVQLYFNRSDSSAYGGKLVTASYSGAGQWQDLVFDVGSDPEWINSITSFRLDPFNGAQDFEIDWIRGLSDSLDSDGDGIMDLTEGAHDSDGDGTPNYLDRDSDNDWVHDDAEILAGTNPYQAEGDGSGTIRRDWWSNIGSGVAVSNLTSHPDYPGNPTGTDEPASFEAPSDWADNYGTRMRGFIHAPATDTYTFWIASDEHSELWLSTNASPANVSLIASVSGSTASREWDKYPSQQSVAVNLTGGQKYFVEVLHKEAGGDDNLAVAWSGAEVPITVIDGVFLSPVTNTAPVFTTDPVVEADAAEDAAYTGATLANDVSDADGDPLTFAKVSGAAWLSVASDGALSGTPAQADVGLNSFTVSVSDGIAAPVLAALEITVIAVNNPPAFTSNPVNKSAATEDSAYSDTLAGSATDPDAGDTLTYSKMSGPAWLAVAGDGTLSGTPANGDVGANVFTVRVTDSGGLFDDATLNITVNNVNDPPAFAADPFSAGDATEAVAYSDSIAGSATDPDAGDTLSYSKTGGPAWLNIASNGALSGTPASGDVGLNAFTVQVDGGNGGSDTATLNITVNAAVSSPDIRVTEYYLTTGDFTGTTATITLGQDLANDYYILVRGSRTGDGSSNPNNDYARVLSVPGGRGDLASSGANDQIQLQRQAADFDWEGVVTVVECQNSASAGGFKLVDAVVTAMTTTSGTDTSASWTDINQVVLFGGYRGGGVEMFGNPGNRKEGTGCYTRLHPSGSGTINWSRDAGGETMHDATMTTFVVEWGSEWTIQHVSVAGNNGGNGADATGEYTTAAINSVVRANTWVWGTGTRIDSGIGDCAEACLVTLGDGVNQNANETTVAVGSEYSDAYDFDVYVMTHPSLLVDHRFKVDGDKTGLDVAVTVDSAPAGARFGWVYNGCNGTGTAFARPRLWSRYTGDTTVTISRGYDGQNFPAWVQGIDFSGLNP